jgi:putative PIN family toxin of toxin-antitoxin system
MSETLDAVLDTNVLVSALRSRNGASFELLRRVGTAGWRLHISTALLLEYEEVARREAAALWARPERVEAILSFIAASAQEHAISFRWRSFLSDRDDDFILELAVAAGARYIITHDLRDFAGAKSFGITALRPAHFLKLLNAITP